MTKSPPDLTKAQQVTFCVDTNVLVEFVSLDRISWKELAPNAVSIRIIIPTKVGEEMDEHKGRSGRLRRRAIEFSQLSRAMEDSPDGVLQLETADPKVTMEFGPLFRKTDLDGERFELDDSDNRIVAEVAAIARSIPDVILLADDSKPVRLARQAGLSYVRPLPAWRRKEGPDERDTEIAELKREIGATPALTVSLKKTSEQGGIIIEDLPGDIASACAEAFVRAVQESAPQISRDALIERYGIQSAGHLDFAASIYGREGLTHSQLDQYEQEYERFLEGVRVSSENLHKILCHLGFSRHLKIAAGNEGDRAAEKVLVEAEVSGPFAFMPTNAISKQLRDMLEAPEPPEPERSIYTRIYPHLNLKEQLGPPRLDLFHDLDEPTSRGDSTYVSWRCEELRQETYFDLPVLIVAQENGAKGLLTITTSSAVIAKKTVMRVPLETRQMNGPAGTKYFLERLRHVPKAYRKAFQRNLSALADGAEDQ